MTEKTSKLISPVIQKQANTPSSHASYGKESKRIYTQSDWSIDFLDVLSSRAEMLRNEIASREAKVKNAPEGFIRVLKKGDSYQYYLRTDPTDTNGKYIKQSEIGKASKILQRDYDQKLIIAMQREIEEIEKCISSISPCSISTVYDSIPESRKQLITPLILPENDYVKSWEAIEYVGKSFSPDDPEIYTMKNERVRSKTERAIANALFSHGIPYRYEYPITINGATYHPDFYCLNVSRRKEVVWEHYGMMDDIGYARNNVDKNAKYQLAGYIPGDNFICTFETSRHPLNDRLIERNIELYLLK